MNGLIDIAKQAIDNFKSTPFLLAMVILNIMVLTGFGYVISKTAATIERREAMFGPIIKACIERGVR